MSDLPTRTAALCLFRRLGPEGDEFLFAEIGDRDQGLLHRPPGGGLEPGETPEEAVRRELHEELGLRLEAAENLGHIDHVWFHNGRNVQERAWIFLADASEYPALAIASTLLEADGNYHPPVWRKLSDDHLPSLCPAELAAILQAKLKS